MRNRDLFVVCLCTGILTGTFLTPTLAYAWVGWLEIGR